MALIRLWMRRWLFSLAVIVSLTGCLGEEAREAPVVKFVPTLTVLDSPRLALEDIGYEPGLPTGFTVVLSKSDVATHGLPERIEFVGHGSTAATSRAVARMSAYDELESEAMPASFECFDEIRIEDATGATILVVGNFCPAGNDPTLTVVGDMAEGTPLGWVFESPSGFSRNNIDASGNIGSDE